MQWGVCVCELLSSFILVGGGGGGGAAAGSEPLAYFRESRTPKIYPILGKSHNPGHSKWSRLQKHFRETFIIPGSRKGSGLGNLILSYGNLMKSHPILWKLAPPPIRQLNWWDPIAITFNTICLVEFYIQWCGALW